MLESITPPATRTSSYTSTGLVATKKVVSKRQKSITDLKYLSVLMQRPNFLTWLKI